MFFRNTRYGTAVGRQLCVLCATSRNPDLDRHPARDHLSAYGYTKIKTPNIDSFAQGGTLFSNVEAQIP